MNVADAYAHPLFHAKVDTQTGFRTRSILCTSISDTSSRIVAVLQVCVCVCVYVRACTCACVHVCVRACACFMWCESLCSSRTCPPHHATRPSSFVPASPPTPTLCLPTRACPTPGAQQAQRALHLLRRAQHAPVQRAPRQRAHQGQAARDRRVSGVCVRACCAARVPRRVVRSTGAGLQYVCGGGWGVSTQLACGGAHAPLVWLVGLSHELQRSPKPQKGPVTQILRHGTHPSSAHKLTFRQGAGWHASSGCNPAAPHSTPLRRENERLSDLYHCFKLLQSAVGGCACWQRRRGAPSPSCLHAAEGGGRRALRACWPAQGMG